MVVFENILEDVGGAGKYQYLQVSKNAIIHYNCSFCQKVIPVLTWTANRINDMNTFLLLKDKPFSNHNF